MSDTASARDPIELNTPWASAVARRRASRRGRIGRRPRDDRTPDGVPGARAAVPRAFGGFREGKHPHEGGWPSAAQPARHRRSGCRRANASLPLLGRRDDTPCTTPPGGRWPSLAGSQGPRRGCPANSSPRSSEVAPMVPRTAAPLRPCGPLRREPHLGVLRDRPPHPRRGHSCGVLRPPPPASPTGPHDRPTQRVLHPPAAVPCDDASWRRPCRTTDSAGSEAASGSLAGTSALRKRHTPTGEGGANGRL